MDDPFCQKIEDRSLSISIKFTEKESIKQAINVDRYAFPCKYLLGRGFSFQAQHPSTHQDQIQAFGVGYGCDICPNFKPDDFEVVGTKTVVKDYFS
jgi:hypothetical protein